MPGEDTSQRRGGSTRERSIVRAILRELNQLPGCIARKRHGDVYATAGDPDIYGLFRGLHFELEVKRPGQAATKLQTYRLEQWAAAGAVTAVVTSVDEAMRAVMEVPDEYR